MRPGRKQRINLPLVRGAIVEKGITMQIELERLVDR